MSAVRLGLIIYFQVAAMVLRGALV